MNKNCDYDTDEELETKLLFRKPKTSKELNLVLCHVKNHGLKNKKKNLQKFRKNLPKRLWTIKNKELYSSLILKRRSKRKSRKRRSKRRSKRKSRKRRSKRRSKRKSKRRSSRRGRSPKRKSRKGRSKYRLNKDNKIILISIKKSPKSNKKYRAIFQKGDKTITTDFGQKGASDYTIHGDIDRRNRYIKRHLKDINTGDPTRAGYLSLYILWNKKSFRASMKDYKYRLNIYNKTKKFPTQIKNFSQKRRSKRKFNIHFPYKSTRKEMTSEATEQCNAVIGTKDEICQDDEPIWKRTCILCQMVFCKKKKSGKWVTFISPTSKTSSYFRGGKIDCDHMLPVEYINKLLCSGKKLTHNQVKLLENKARGGYWAPETNSNLRVYVSHRNFDFISWVHDNCNQLKSNLPFVKLIDQNGDINVSHCINLRGRKPQILGNL